PTRRSSDLVKFVYRNADASVVIREEPPVALGGHIVRKLARSFLKRHAVVYNQCSNTIQKSNSILHIFLGRFRGDQDVPGMVLVTPAVQQLHNVKTVFRFERLGYLILLQTERGSFVFRHHLSAPNPAHVSPVIRDAWVIGILFRQFAEILSSENSVANGTQFFSRRLLLLVIYLCLSDNLRHFHFSRKVWKGILRNSGKESLHFCGSYG